MSHRPRLLYFEVLRSALFKVRSQFPLITIPKSKSSIKKGIGSNPKSSKPLNEQKNKPNNSYTYSYSSSTSSYSGSGPRTTPSWTHQPAPSQIGVTRSELGGPASMVGDITGKSWNSTAAPPNVAVASSIGIVNKNPNLFGDLLNSALGGNKGGSNVPLKNVTPAKGSFSMGGMGDSLPKTSSVGGSGIGGNSSGRVGGGGGGWGSFQSSGSGAASMNMGSGLGMGSGSGIGGQSLRTGGGGGGVGMSSNNDPFGSLGNFSSKPMKNSTGIGSAGKPASGSSENFNFGDFQYSSKSNQPTGNPLGSNAGSVPKMGSFGTQNQSTPVQSTGADSFDFFASSGSANSGGANVASQEFSGGDDFGLDSSFGGGHDEGGTTTELEGLPPAPAGVSASTAKTKGLDNYKQGQYADAIKWLSWAEALLEKAGESAGTMEVLSCRASCYKEVGEYKKAVADCTKVLDRDEKNVAVLVQRALLYESMEKYRLGADDLRTVMKIDPGNRVARSTIHRLTKMADQ